MGRPPGPESTTFSIRLETQELQAIDHAATQAGISRTQYILSWLPEHHNRNSENPPNDATQERRE